MLVLSELAPSERAAAALMDVLFVAQNAHDPWLPDAVGIAGAKHGLNFLTQVIERRVQGNDRAVFTGIGRAVDVMTPAHSVAGASGRGKAHRDGAESGCGHRQGHP